MTWEFSMGQTSARLSGTISEQATKHLKQKSYLPCVSDDQTADWQQTICLANEGSQVGQQTCINFGQVTSGQKALALKGGLDVNIPRVPLRILPVTEGVVDMTPADVPAHLVLDAQSVSSVAASLDLELKIS